jgi:hypothetical protein
VGSRHARHQALDDRVAHLFRTPGTLGKTAIATVIWLLLVGNGFQL